jgi:hypothetical protein
MLREGLELPTGVTSLMVLRMEPSNVLPRHTGAGMKGVEPGADRASVQERSGAAGRALECHAEPYAGGSGDYGGRVLFSYDVRGRTKVAFIAANSMRDFNDDKGWGIETWSQCDPSELPDQVTSALGIQVWHDASGNRIPVAKIESYPGPEHCDWQDITFLTVDTKSGERLFVRDSTGELGDLLVTAYDAVSTLPKHAIDTGFERGGRHLWLHPNGTAAYLVRRTSPESVERWPAAKQRVACA